MGQTISFIQMASILGQFELQMDASWHKFMDLLSLTALNFDIVLQYLPIRNDWRTQVCWHLMSYPQRCLEEACRSRFLFRQGALRPAPPHRPPLCSRLSGGGVMGQGLAMPTPSRPPSGAAAQRKGWASKGVTRERREGVGIASSWPITPSCNPSHSVQDYHRLLPPFVAGRGGSPAVLVQCAAWR